MRFSIYPKVFYRVPQFSLEAEMRPKWEDLKLSIKTASLDFYETIKDIDADELESLSPGIDHTLWKYFNRGKYRATPSGTFAGFGIAPMSTAGEGVVIDGVQKVHEFTDWSYIDQLTLPFSQLLDVEFFVFANSSYYKIGDSIRYISHLDGAFQLSEVEENALQLHILDLCRKPVLFSELVEQIGIDDNYGVIEELIDLQLLLTSRDPNIIGGDYFQRCGVVNDEEKIPYLISERPYLSGSFDQRVFNALPELVERMYQSFSLHKSEELSAFVLAFKKKFERGEVPLLKALDPELGVGYGMEVTGNGDDLAARFAVSEEVLNVYGNKTLTGNIKNKMLSGTMQQPVLDLEELFGGLNAVDSSAPNSFNAVGYVADELLVLEKLGGFTPNALLGRFTLENEEVTGFCRELSDIESAANPDVLFFDIAYVAEGQVDNVNRRNVIYDYQLSILNYDLSPSPLEMNDLYVVVRGEELVLFSRKLKKRLVPRLASAYNYTRSDLSIFRFLCDLQGQGLQAGASIHLEQMFPDLSFYPRMQYKNIVLTPAKWRLKYSDHKSYLEADSPNAITYLESVLCDLGITSDLLYRQSDDMTLTFESSSEKDKQALLILLKKQKELLLEEAFIPKKSSVEDDQGKQFKSQLILFLTHSERVYEPYTPVAQQQFARHGVQRTFLPGSEWMYFEMYCHVYRSDALLGELIAPFLAEYGRYIKSWFFIRYKENGDHLRLRILLHDAGFGQLLVSGLSAVLSEHLESGIVSELLMKTYKREVERYAAGGMENVEAHFGVDSDYVLSLLGLDLGVMDKYRLCVWVAVSVMESGLISPVVFERLVGRICDSFAIEHKVEVSGFKELNNEYKVFKKFVPVALEGVALEHGNMFLSSLLSVLSGCDVGRRGQLFGDLMHMHVNRLFADQQRTHEMIMYYFLQKELLMRKAMAGKQAVEI